MCSESPITSGSVPQPTRRQKIMNSIVYIVGAIVIIIAILSFLGLR